VAIMLGFPTAFTLMFARSHDADRVHTLGHRQRPGRPNAGYDVRLASGVITAGGTLGILIPPSVMIIVYAAVAGQSVVKLYAAAMFPGFFLSFLYLLYVLGWAILQPSVAPRLPPEKLRAPISPWVAHLAATYSPRLLPALLRAQRLVEEWVLGMNLTPLQFLLLSQAIVFVLGWPLEWSEIS
jgi:TRAP-type mannitol/chloroaromatic compound transport system permease large subunit